MLFDGRKGRTKIDIYKFHRSVVQVNIVLRNALASFAATSHAPFDAPVGYVPLTVDKHPLLQQSIQIPGT